MALEGYTSAAALAAGEAGRRRAGSRSGARADLTAFAVDPLTRRPATSSPTHRSS